MDRLRAAPAADIPGIALKLDGIVTSIDSMPLAFEQRPRGAGAPATRPKAPPASPMEAGYWQALAADIWRETKELVRVERVDRPDPGLLSPSQSFFLRENLKLRLLNARLALLSRDGRVFREDVRQAREWIEHYFDMSAKPVQTSVATLKALAAADVVAELPSLNDTLGALHNLRVAKEKK
jgi:uroporphyrin-3 C-methyltransferase